MMIKRLSAFIIILGLVSLSAIKAGAQANLKDETPVYAAVIDALFSGTKISDKPIKLLLLENQTRFDDFEGEKAVNARALAFNDLKPETMESFVRQNAQRSPFTNPVKASVRVQLIESKLTQETVSGNKWKAFYAAYPDSSGIISLSKIGFDKEGKQALVYVAHVYGEDTGRGTILFLQKIGQQWKVQDKLFNWVWTG